MTIEEALEQAKQYAALSDGKSHLICMLAREVEWLQSEKDGYASAFDDQHAEIERLQKRVEELEALCVRSLSVVIDAIMHGMPVTKEIADLRNQLVKLKGGDAE